MVSGREDRFDGLAFIQLSGDEFDGEAEDVIANGAQECKHTGFAEAINGLVVERSRPFIADDGRLICALPARAGTWDAARPARLCLAPFPLGPLDQTLGPLATRGAVPRVGWGR
jgi:hypothetical protein